tara:strand:- start:138 stop:1367 length:1230 start_codon:yes stop_codon:yes gene_type:complete
MKNNLLSNYIGKDKNKLKSKSIFIWSSSFLPNIGGLQSSVMNISKYLISNGWSLKIITNKYPITLKSHESINNIEIFRLYFLNNPKEYLRNWRVDLLVAWLIVKPITIIKLFLYFRRYSPKIVNLHFPDNQLTECLILKYFFEFKLIISMHGNDVEKLSKIKRGSIKFRIYNKLFKSTELVTVCSNYLIEKLENIPHKISCKKLLFYNGINKNFIQSDLHLSKNDHFFFVGRSVPIKGFDLLLKAFKTLEGHELLIGGFNELKDLKVNDHIFNQIKFLGKIGPKRISELMSVAKVTVVPSRNDSFGIVVAEALCSGSPVIATNVGGIPEVIDLAKSDLNKNEKLIFDNFVKLVDPNSDSIREGIRNLIDNYINIKDYIDIIPKIRIQFDWGKRMQGLTTVLNELNNRES